MLLTSAHIASRHNGVRLSLAQLPSDVHVCEANRSMIKLIHRCALCRSRRGKQLTVPAGPLYMNSEPAAPFERVAVDGFGPYHLKNGRKFWGIVVVCLSSRCVRITVLENLTPSEALSSLMFVWNSVGRPNFVITDNATNFSHIYRAIRSAKIDIVWWTTTPLSPWMNGSAERFVKLTKSCLSVFDRHYASFFQMEQRFREAEFITFSNKRVNFYHALKIT